MNVEKLKKLQSQVRIGGKGTPRRKKKVVHQTAATDDKKLQGSLKKLAVNTIAGIEEVNMIKDDGSVINFNNPKTQASLASNIFAITGHGETKQITEMLPGILTQLGPEGLNQLKRLASNVVIGNKLLNSVNEEDDDVPNLVENFEEIAKKDEEAQKSVASTSPATTTTAADATVAAAAPEAKAEEAKVEEPAKAEPAAPVAAATPVVAAAAATAPEAASPAKGGKGGKKDDKPKTPEPKKEAGGAGKENKKAEGKGATPKKDDKSPKKKEDKKNA